MRFFVLPHDIVYITILLLMVYGNLRDAPLYQVGEKIFVISIMHKIDYTTDLPKVK